jgi:cellulose biosynthesis protein BcsQ
MAVAFGHSVANSSESLAALLTETPAPSVQKMVRQSEYHRNLFYIPSNRSAMVTASRILPTLMANETRLSHALQTIKDQFAYIIIDTPPTMGDLLINSLVAANLIIIPVETSYLGVAGLIDLQRTIDLVKVHFRPDLKIMGYLPTLVEELRSEVQEILSQMQERFPNLVLTPIHKSTDLAYAHSSHMDVFTYRPPRQRKPGQIYSSSRPTQEYSQLVDYVINATYPIQVAGD